MLADEITIPHHVVKQHIYESSVRTHYIAFWIGVVFNILWFISDYFILPSYRVPFLWFRLGVSSLSFLIYYFRKQLKIDIYSCVFVIAVGIAIQNAYMWSVMDVSHVQMHTFAYIALFIGVGMLVLWDFKLLLYLLIITIISNVAFFVVNSSLSLGQFLTNGALLTLSVAVFCMYLATNRYRLIYNDIKSRLALEKSKKMIEFQKEQVDFKNDEIISSLRYAKRLQEALLPPKTLLDNLFNRNYFIFYKPRDIVSGDFYWARKIITTPKKGESREYKLIAVADCTGHGVPGAFMSLLGLSFLDQSAIEEDINSPAEALDFLNQKIIKTLNKSYEDEQIRDGMDISLIAIDVENKQLAFSGANNPVYIIRNKNLEILKPDKQAIGHLNNEILPYSNTIIQLQENDCVYLFSDGYADQFGGPKGKKLMRKMFEKILIETSDKTMSEQLLNLETKFNQWKDKLEQVDDVCVLGIRI